MLNLLKKIDASAASRLVLEPGRRPSEELPRYRNFLKVETHRLKMLHRGGAGGREICQARAAILDVLLQYILEAASNVSATELKNVKPPPLALVAIGGYGRAELNPFSDIDIMFLHSGEMVTRGKTHPYLTAVTDGLLYTLWDIGMKVGHSVRTVDDCVRVANADMQSKTSLIESRLVAGDRELFLRFQKIVLAKCIAGHEDAYVQARMEDQEARRIKFGNSPLMQEPNIKNGCGGLRDYQNLIWMTFFKYRMRSLSDLQDKEMISESERKQLELAYDYLLRARNELHYHVGRAVDVLSKNVQPAVASNLGHTDRSPSKRLESFMGEFYNHTRNIDLITRMVEQRLALVRQATLLPSFKLMIQNRRQKGRQQLVDGFKFLDGQIYPASNQVFKEHPERLMRVFLYSQQRGLRLHPDTAQMIRSDLRLVDNAFLHNEHVRETFLEILDQRGNVASILRAMHEVGFLGKFIPEFGRLTCLVQHEFYHQYTADEHTLICIERLDQIWHAKEPPYNTYTEIFQNLDQPFILYLALLLHDSGKAYRSGKHEEIGGQLAIKVGRRLGLHGSAAHSLSLLIENHLAMAQISQRRDLDDPTVIRSFANQIQRVENLEMLTLHTFADSMGTSDKLWNGFKDTLHWTLFHKTRQVLAGGTEFIRAEAKHRQLLMEEVERLMPGTFGRDELEAHFDHLPPRYFQIHSSPEILADLALVHRFMRLQIAEADDALAPIITWNDEPDRGYTSVNICTWDRAGLFSKIAGSLTAAGLNILSAEIVTRTDGIILDTFYVTDAKTALMAQMEDRERFEQILRKVLMGGHVDLQGLIARRKGSSAYASIEGERIPTVISIDNETSETRTIIDVEAEDRMGVLYVISQAMNELDLDISLAKIVTEKGAAVDSFYVSEQLGKKITGEERLKGIERKLRNAIGNMA